MILYPAIDLKDRQAVRLVRGDMNQATVFNTDPVDQARVFRDHGFAWIHVVDLNGAFAGAPVNGKAVTAILAAVDSKIQLGGGIRTMDTVDFWLGQGVARVVLGTVALRDPGLVRSACAKYPGQIAVGLDSRGGRVAIEGWAQATDRAALEVAMDFADAGVAAIIHTDIDRDGVLTGVNVAATAALAQAQSIPVIASGGVSSLDDLRALLAVEDQGVQGVIAGRALYDGGLDPVEALALLAA